MIYADFEYYKNIYGGTMAKEEYDRLSRRASAYLDFVCFDRIAEVTEKIKDACCAVADIYLLNEQGGGIASETNDGISVTYANSSAMQTDSERLYRAALLYLGHTGLMYRGVVE